MYINSHSKIRMTTDFNEFSIPEEEEEVTLPIEDKISIEENIPSKINTVHPESNSKSKSIYVSNETHRIYTAPLSPQILNLLVKRKGSKFNHFDFNNNVKDEFQNKLTKKIKQIIPSCTVVFDKNPDMIVQDSNGNRLCGVQWIYFNREDQCDTKKWYVDLVFMKYSNDQYYDALVQTIKSFFEQLEKTNNTKNVTNRNTNHRTAMNNRTNKNRNTMNNRTNNRTVNNRNQIGGGKRRKTHKKRKLHRRR